MRVKNNPYKPGEAYALSNAALKAGDLEKARELLKYMESTDAAIVEKRIAQTGGGVSGGASASIVGTPDQTAKPPR